MNSLFLRFLWSCNIVDKSIVRLGRKKRLVNDDDLKSAERAYKLGWLDVSTRKARGQFDAKNEETCTG